MSKSFSNFCDEDSKKENKKQEDLQSTYEELKNMNYDELTQRLYNEVKLQKQNGSFNYESLCQSIESIRPFISNETYHNMKNMLEKIK